MAKYSVPEYGDGTRYGESAETTWTETGEVQWIFQVDWNNDGSYEGTNEAAWMVGLNGSRGRQYYVKSDGSGFDPVQPGTYTLTMDNTSGRYDPFNTSSPLYPNIKPGHKAKLSVKHISTGETYARITGEIDDIRPISGTDQVRIVIVDGMKRLDRDISTEQASYSIGAGTAISNTLDLANWGGNRSIQDSDLELMMFDVDEQSALDVINGIAEASLGTFFIARGGAARYYDLGYNSMPTYDIDQSQILKEIQINQPWDEIRNDIKVKSTKWVKTGLMTIWSLAAPQYLAPLQTVSFTANYDPAMDLAQYTFTANDEADGSGLSRTPYVRCSRTVRQGSTKFWFTNYFTGNGVYLTSLRIYGRKLVEISTTFDDEDTDSQNDYGVRSFELESEYMQDNTHAEAYAGIILDHLKDPLKLPIIQIQQRPDIQFEPDLFDKIALTVAKKGIDDTFRIGGIEEQWLDPSGQSTLTTFYLQDVIYSTESIGTDPPTVAIIPEDPTYGGGPGSEPEPPEGPGVEEPLDSNCIEDLEYPANGPYSVEFSGEYLSSMLVTWVIPYHCWLRQKGAVNPTRYQIDADWQKRDGSGVMQDTLDDDFYEVYALDKYGNRVATGVKDPVVGTGEVRTGYFEPPAPVEITALEIDFSTWDRIYLADPEVSPETVTNSATVQYGAVSSTGSLNWQRHGAGVRAEIKGVTMSTRYGTINLFTKFTPPTGISYYNKFYSLYSKATYTSSNGATVTDPAWNVYWQSLAWAAISGTRENPSAGVWTFRAEFEYDLGITTPDWLQIEIKNYEGHGYFGPNYNVVVDYTIYLYPRATYRIDVDSFLLWNICPV